MKRSPSRQAACYTPGRWRPERSWIELASIPTDGQYDDGGAAERGPLKLGQVIDGCRVISVLGEGAMATAYLGYRPKSREFVTIKALHARHASYRNIRQYFQYEGDCLRQVRSTHTPSLISRGTLSEYGPPYLITPFCAGNLLQRLARVDPRLDTVRGIVEIGLQLASALATMHALKIVHRDVKRENVVVRNGHRLHCRLIDFGVARPHLPGVHTETCGTAQINPPQQARAEDADPRDDLFSLGILLYERLAGCHPAAGDDGAFSIGDDAYLDDLANGRIRFVHLAERDPTLPRALCDIVMRLLSFKREDRYADGWRLGTDLLPFTSTLARADFVRERQRARGQRSLRRTRPEASARQPGGSPARKQRMRR